MKELRSYSSPFNLGHRAVADLWDGEVFVQEKIDGSQFSFGLVPDSPTPVRLFCRSRRQMIDMDDPGMFALGVETARKIAHKLEVGWTYRGEFIGKPKQNTLTYERVPAGNIILYDIDQGDQHYVELYHELPQISHYLGLECVPLFEVYHDKPARLDELKAYLERDSVLGGCKIEGIALKNYDKYGPDKKVLMGKLVSEAFREKHEKGWPKRNPNQTMFIDDLAKRYAVEARWMKAVQHLREQGEIKGEPQDIPTIMREIVRDVETECADEIRDALWKQFWPKIRRGISRGAPEWYKNLLAEESHGI